MIFQIVQTFVDDRIVCSPAVDTRLCRGDDSYSKCSEVKENQISNRVCFVSFVISANVAHFNIAKIKLKTAFSKTLSVECSVQSTAGHCTKVTSGNEVCTVDFSRTRIYCDKCFKRSSTNNSTVAITALK